MGDALGEPGTLEAIDLGFGLYAPGLINLAEVSLLPADVLENDRPDEFVLATLDFIVTGLVAGAPPARQLPALQPYRRATAAAAKHPGS